MEATLSRFAPIKINLFLEVLGKRADGFHEIVTVMETLAIGDTVCATPAETTTLEVDRDDVPTGPENTIFKIAAAAERRLGRPLNAKFRLTKRTPPQSGLGAGSSDAAAGLDLLLASHGLAPSLDLKREIAAEAGSDVPFFFGGGVATCTGRGERIEPTTARGARHVVLVLGGVACSTPVVYRRARAGAPPRDVAPWLDALRAGATLAHDDGPEPFNRLQEAAESAYPELLVVKEKVRATLGRAPILSGSGGAYFLLEASEAAARSAAERLKEARPELDVRATSSYRGASAYRGAT